jgi:NAD/NADP transhydrogenase beta subunit
MKSYCSICGSKLAASGKFCPSCGYVRDVGTAPSWFLILLMWFLTGLYFGFLENQSPTGTLFGMSSFAIAIYLVTRKHNADKINGWIRIGIGIVIGLIVFMSTAQR